MSSSQRKSVTRPLAILLTVALLLAPIPAQAQISCGTHDNIVNQLSKTYGEVLYCLGLSSPKAIFELYINKTTGTWSILITTPNGWTCIMAVGTDWHSFTLNSGTPT